MLFYFVI